MARPPPVSLTIHWQMVEAGEVEANMASLPQEHLVFTLHELKKEVKR